jgi:hypothetical protein
LISASDIREIIEGNPSDYRRHGKRFEQELQGKVPIQKAVNHVYKIAKQEEQ